MACVSRRCQAVSCSEAKGSWPPCLPPGSSLQAPGRLREGTAGSTNRTGTEHTPGVPKSWARAWAHQWDYGEALYLLGLGFPSGTLGTEVVAPQLLGGLKPVL